jgi:phospholipid-transporting ATPase
MIILAETIEFIRMAGIKLWVLTGDKVDTAKNIGFSCKLLVNEGMEIFQYPKNYSDLFQATDQIRNEQQAAKRRKSKTALLVEGAMLETIMSKQHKELYKAFAEIALASDVVLCCRVTPVQKQQIVALVKSELPKAVTLSIGDGANDVNMITEAHVGVGIRGVEGQQAARAADYAIGEFQLLKRLMFFHGRENYRKNSNLVLYNFYKNVLLNFPNFWFGYFNWFSGQTAYDEVGYQLFNLFFTSVPIFIYAIFDRQTTDTVLLKNPKYYGVGPQRLLFNASRFWRWFFWAVFFSFLITMSA